MIKVFNNNETEFLTNGEAVIIPTKAKVKNADNGDFYLELSCNSKYKDYIQANNIIVAPTPSGEQPFRIRTVTKKGFKLEVKAWHLYYDSINYLIADSYAVDLDCNAAMNHFNSATDVTSPFEVYSNISDKNTYRCVRTSLRDCFNTVIERWGGHLVRNKWNISILSSIGKDNGITIEYGKNLSDINAEYDWTDVVTKLLPVGKDGILLDNLYVYSQIQYDLHFCKSISFEQDINEEDYQSQEEYIAALKADLLIQATNYLDKYQYPQVNYNVKGRPELVSDIGDVIRVHDKRLGIDITTQVIAYEYDAITGRYTSLEFGNFGKTLSDIVAAINSSINNKVDKSVVGATGGVASLGSDGKVPINQLPPPQTVNNGILTIQRNGVKVQTFSANSFDNKTANIEVPTKTSDLTNDSKFINTVDSALSDSSINPVQNKVINAELISGKTATGDIVTLSDSAPMNASNVTVNIVAQQLGSGEPSPTNIRPISGWDAVNITQKDNMANPTVTNTYTIQLGDTYYGGTLDVTRGLLTVNKGYKLLGDWSWTAVSGYTGVFKHANVDFPTQVDNFICSHYSVASHSLSVANMPDKTIKGYPNTTENSLYIKDSTYSDATTFITYLQNNNVQLVYELATPYTIQLTPEQIKLLENNNTLYADTGDITLVYQPNNMIGEALSKAEEGYDAQMVKRPALKSLTITNKVTSNDGTAVINELPKAIIVGAYLYNTSNDNTVIAIPYLAASGNLPFLKICSDSTTLSVLSGVSVSGIIYYFEI